MIEFNVDGIQGRWNSRMIEFNDDGIQGRWS